MEPEQIAKSPSDFSCHSYELFVGQEKGNDDNNKEKMSIRSEGLESVSEIRTAPTALASAKQARKVSTVSMSECLHASLRK
jgi:voltage-gated sodium channel type II alpha